MRLDAVALRIREAETTFGDRVAGAAELANAESETLVVPTAFIVQTSESAEPNILSSGLEQILTEQFSVIAAIDNSADETGNTAYNSLHTIRGELWGAILNWLPTGYETPISYVGGNVLDVRRSYLLYQFNFSIGSRVTDEDGYTTEVDDDLLRIRALDASGHGVDIDGDDEAEMEINVDLEGAG